MLLLKHMGFWMFQQAADVYKNVQSHRWEFFLHFPELPTPSPQAEGRAGGIRQDQQTPSARCKSGTHSLT